MMDPIEEWEQATKARRDADDRMRAVVQRVMLYDVVPPRATLLLADLRYAVEQACEHDGLQAAFPGEGDMAEQRPLDDEELAALYCDQHQAGVADSCLLTAKDWRVAAFIRGYDKRWEDWQQEQREKWEQEQREKWEQEQREKTWDRSLFPEC